VMTHPRKQHQASAMRRATPHEGEKRKGKKNGDSSSITRLDLLVQILIPRSREEEAINILAAWPALIRNRTNA
jgi:hypothetical protein